MIYQDSQTKNSTAYSNLQNDILAEKARRKLADYTEFIHGLIPAKHHLVWIEALEDESIKRLLIIAPPAHAKTFYCGIAYPAWKIGRNPNVHIGYISNTARQAQRQSVAVRDIVDHNENYGLVFPHILPDKEKGWAEFEWYIKREDPGDKDSTLAASGVFGPILGNRFDEIIFDDICDEENMATQYQRDKLREWVATTAMSRLTSEGRTICIMTRWHQEDIATYFMDLGFCLIHMPAVNELGDALWPEQWPIEAVESKRLELGSAGFTKMYQGNPQAEEGAIFKREWWQYYKIRPEFKRLVQSWDTAFKKGAETDYSVCSLWAEADKGYFLIDIFREKLEFPELKRAFVAAYDRDRPNAVLVEDTASGQSLIQEIRRDTSIPVLPIKVDKDKVARANSVTPLIEAGRVFLPERASWLYDYIEELAAFPLGAHDDQVDSTTQALSWLAQRAEVNIRWL